MTIKLSEAIRQGAKLRPMATGDFFVKEEWSEDVSSCALGAAYEAIHRLEGVAFDDDDYDLMLKSLRTIEGRLFEDWPILNQVWCEARSEWIAEGNDAPITLQEVIQDMNDFGKFTREEIADWLESIGE